MKTANLLSILLIAQVHTAWARTTITGRFEVVWGDPPPVAGQRLESTVVLGADTEPYDLLRGMNLKEAAPKRR